MHLQITLASAHALSALEDSFMNTPLYPNSFDYPRSQKRYPSQQFNSQLIRRGKQIYENSVSNSSRKLKD